MCEPVDDLATSDVDVSTIAERMRAALWPLVRGRTPEVYIVIQVSGVVKEVMFEPVGLLDELSWLPKDS